MGLKLGMKKFIKGEFISTWGMTLIFFGSLILTFFVLIKIVTYKVSSIFLNLIYLKIYSIIPKMSFCNPNPNFLCEIPWIKRVFLLLDTDVILGIILFASIFSIIFFAIHFIFKLLGFRSAEDIEEDNK